MGALTREDLDAVRALWEEWAVGTGFTLTVMVVGEHRAAAMDPDRPLGAIVRADMSLQVSIQQGELVIFSEPCPYDGGMLRASVAMLARVIGREPPPLVQ